MKIEINIRFSIFGSHNWPNPVFEEVEFLKYPHTHTFNFRCKFKVTHTDRDKEFFVEKDKILKFLELSYLRNNHIMDFRDHSCEKIASILMAEFKEMIECEVQEDNLDSAVVVRN